MLQRVIKWLFPIALFLISFVPRVEGLVARSILWHHRAQVFMEAVASRQWADTWLAPHPGVTTMWLISSARWLATLSDPDFANTPQLNQLISEIIPLTFIISLLIVLTYFLLARIFDPIIAGTATLLLALDPNHITISKTLHPDPLLSVLMLVSALFLILFVLEQRRYVLIISGIFAGLALLTKTPALFLIPYFFLCLLVWKTDELVAARSEFVWDGRLPGRWLKGFLPATLLWIGALMLSYVLVWPAMWSTPVTAVNNSIIGSLVYRGEAHEKPVLFLGEVLSVDPGPFFYPVHMALKSTELVLPLFLIAVVLSFVTRHLGRRERVALFLLLAFILFFTIQMTFGAKKSERYILPAMQVMPILAAFAAVTLTRWLANGRRPILLAVLTAIVVIQALISLPRHPFYGTHFNRFFGSPRQILEGHIIAGQDQAEGMEMAAAYLNSLPQADLLVVGTKKSEAFHRYFNGQTTNTAAADADYLVFTRNEIVRNLLDSEEAAQWQKVQGNRPKYMVTFDDIPYVWVYKNASVIEPSGIPNQISATLGSDIKLIGYDLKPDQLEAGDSFELTLYWEAVNKPAGDFNVFTHLLDPAGALHTQQDNPPQNGFYPTYLWDSQEIIEDSYHLVVDPQAQSGQYDLAVGLYSLTSLERLPVMSAAGERQPNNQLLIPGPLVQSQPP